jgi:hypothetical protein
LGGGVTASSTSGVEGESHELNQVGVVDSEITETVISQGVLEAQTATPNPNAPATTESPRVSRDSERSSLFRLYASTGASLRAARP